jgi:hypothetical protein
MSAHAFAPEIGRELPTASWSRNAHANKCNFFGAACARRMGRPAVAPPRRTFYNRAVPAAGRGSAW